LNKIILFPRGKTIIAATIIKTVLEPLDTGNGRQVVFFCQDKTGKKYRVPRSDVLVMGKSKTKARKSA
jgi:hypothetical protein